jgi:broad specificity phosphatase PhoE
LPPELQPRKHWPVTSLVLIRHAEPLVVGDTPGAQWRLTNEGKDNAGALGRRIVEREPITLVWASPERKARETAEHAFPSVPARVREQLSEVEKPWYPTTDELRLAVARYLGGDVVDGWERREDVLARLDLLEAELSPGDLIAVVSHGVLLTVWLDRLGALDDPFAFWSDLRTPDAWKLDVDQKSLERLP